MEHYSFALTCLIKSLIFLFRVRSIRKKYKSEYSRGNEKYKIFFVK